MQCREPFPLQETTELEAIVETVSGRDFPCRPDGASTEERRFEDGLAALREIGPRVVNGPHDRVYGHCDHEKKATLF